MTRAYKELKSLNEKDLKSRIQDLKKELIKVKAQSTTTTPKNPYQIKNAKKNIARILTLLRETELSKLKIKKTSEVEKQV